MTSFQKKNKMNNEKVILIAGYGTSYIDQFEKVILKIKKIIEDKFEDFDVKLCFTSQIVIDRLKKNNVIINNVEESLDDIRNKYKTVIVQPLHFISGVEYEKIVDTCKKYKEYFERLIGASLLGVVISTFQPFDTKPSAKAYETSCAKEDKPVEYNINAVLSPFGFLITNCVIVSLLIT